MSSTAQVIDLVPPTSAAETALAEIRAQLGRNGAASSWSSLPIMARALICRAAGLPEVGRLLELNQFEIEQQEAIRLTLRELLPILQVFSGTVLARREWYRTNRQREQVQPEPKNSHHGPPANRADTLESHRALLKQINHQSPQTLNNEE